MAIDPVCKMDVDEKTARFTTEHKSETHHFCAPGCKKAFEENPKEYVG
jgi:YHS domain-containing protein